MIEANLAIVKRFKKEAARKFHVAKMIFFGSRASGGFSRDSDFDIVVVSKDFEGVRKSRRSPGLRMLWNFDYPVDLLCYTPAEFARRLNGFGIAAEAARKGIVV